MTKIGCRPTLRGRVVLQRQINDIIENLFCGRVLTQQAHDVVTTSMRRHVASTSFRRHVPTRFLINQCQIIAFLILKSYIIKNSRIELRGINLKLHFLSFYPSAWYICDFCLFHIEIEGKCRWIIGGGAKGMLPPLSNHWGACPPPPLPPSSYAYDTLDLINKKDLL